ncbi:MAG: hypothetical protein RR623_06780 [Bacilli bacterium]
MKLIKNSNGIVLLNNDVEIESYNFDTEISFKKFVEYLLSLNLSEKIVIEDTIDGKNESEENLVRLIKQIEIDYNNKVDELIIYKESVLQIKNKS